MKQLEKQRKAEEKEAEKQKKIQEKAAKADAIAKKKEEKQRKNDEKEAEKQRKLHEKAVKAEAAAAKKAERDAKKAEREAKKAERDAKKAERDAKKAEREAKKAERDAKKAESDAKKVQVTSSPETQVDESQPANIQVECLQNPVSDQEAEKVSEIAINTTNSPIQNENIVVLDETLVQSSPHLVEIPCEVPTNTPVDFGSDEELETNTSSDLISKIIKIEEQEECEDKNNTTSDSVNELTEEEWEKEIHGDETDMQKIVRLRKEAFSLLGRARKLEKSLPTNVSDDVEKEKDKDMREIEGIWYHVDTDGYIFNRSDELVGFMDNDEITFTPGWDTTRGTWEYE